MNQCIELSTMSVLTLGKLLNRVKIKQQKNIHKEVGKNCASGSYNVWIIVFSAQEPPCVRTADKINIREKWSKWEIRYTRDWLLGIQLKEVLPRALYYNIRNVQQFFQPSSRVSCTRVMA